MQDEAYIRIPLQSRTGDVRAYALVDHADAHLIERHRWYLSNGYAVRQSSRVNGTQRHIRMHRVILGLPDMGPSQADHINGDRLDNRRVNLRVVTNAQNMQNRYSYRGSTSRYRGVSWDKSKQRWRAYAQIRNRHWTLGTYADELDAAAAASIFRILFVPYSIEKSLGVSDPLS